MNEGVLAQTGAYFSVSVTTRTRRPGERDGEDYSFVGDDAFDELVSGGALLEWAEYGGNRYGTPRSEVVAALERGRHVVVDIENDGARQVKAAFPAAVLVFIMPPSRRELERRLRARGDTTQQDTSRRLAVVEEQIRDAERCYDHLVVNDRLDNAISQVVSILEAPISADPGVEAHPDRGGTNTRSSPA